MFSGSAIATGLVCDIKADVRKSPGGAHDRDGEPIASAALGCRIAFRKQPEAHLSGERISRCDFDMETNFRNEPTD